MKKVVFTPIGIIHSPFKTRKGTPIQSPHAKEAEGTVEVFPEYAEGLADLDGFSHLLLLYHFHKSEGFNLKVTPFLDSEVRGVFATRAPRRPNSIGLSITKLVRIENNVIHVKWLDILDGTPLLDIKPYVNFFDNPKEEIRTGWLTGKKQYARKIKADRRFL